MDDRVAIVTGAGSGIGAAAARLLAERGLEVALVGRRDERLRAVEAEIVEAGGRAFCVRADLGEPRAPWDVVDAVLEARGRLDVIVNNAATFRLMPIEQFSLEEFDDVMASTSAPPTSWSRSRCPRSAPHRPRSS